MEVIRVADDNWGFETRETGHRFVPVGSNYCGVIERVEVGGYFGQVFPLFGVDAYTEKDGVEEARRAFGRMAELGLNVVRTWLEPDVFFPSGLRLDPAAAEKLDRLLEIASKTGIRLSLGMHLSPFFSRGMSAGKIRNFEMPHKQRLLEHLAILGARYGKNGEIFSWTLIGEGTLPWETEQMRSKWPAWLGYWYDGDVESLSRAWGPDVTVTDFESAPVPPRNTAATLSLLEGAAVLNGVHDPLAGSAWRYDWRMFMEEIGSAAVHEQARVLRCVGAEQMITVGNNSWTYPDLPAGQMGTGYNPYFYLDSVDYLCQHNYPFPQCFPGAPGDPLESEMAMAYWLTANEIMGRIYGSMGKPVVLEEWGWYGGGTSSFMTPLPHRSEDDQARFCDLMMQTSQSTFAGWIYWQWRDMPRAADITNLCGIYAADGNRVKPWGKCYGEWAKRLSANPPARKKAKSCVPLPMKDLYTSDVAHQAWWRKTIADYPATGPVDFEPVFERKPIMINS